MSAHRQKKDDGGCRLGDRDQTRSLEDARARTALHTLEMDLERTLAAFRLQAGLCKHLGSPFYAALMQLAHDDVAAGGPVRDLVRDFAGDPLRGFLPLRVLGGVHARVLAGAAPDLAAFYPTVGGEADGTAAWPSFRATIDRDIEQIRARLELAPQTNEVRRCAGLLAGFLQVARDTRLPLRLLEIGCSAGLNLQWSQFKYDLECWSWGDQSSALEIATRWRGAAPAVHDVEVEIAERRGCDVAPRPIDDDDAVRDLECFIWADQPRRLAQLRAGVEIARRDRPEIECAPAGDWLPDQLATTSSGSCTIVYHSSVWTYIPAAEQTRIKNTLEAAGRAATAAKPLAWLRAEDSENGATIELRLRVWPDGQETLLGEGHPHGRVVVWRPEPADAG